MKTWFHTHPFIACFLAAAVVFIATASWFFILFGETFSGWDVAALAVFIFCALLMVRSTNKAAVLVLAACVLLSSSAKAEEEFQPAALWFGGAIVIGVGVWVGYKIITCGRRIAASRTNAEPEELNFIVAGAGAADEYAGAFFWPSTECYQERRNGTNEVDPVCITMNIFVESATNCTMTLSGQSGSQFVETFDECKERAAGIGLFVPSSPQFSASYSRNRQRCAAEQVPLSFDRVTHTVTTGAGGIAVTVERSDDVAGPWHPLARFNVGAGSEIEIRDASIERQFYRVTTGAIPD